MRTIKRTTGVSRSINVHRRGVAMLLVLVSLMCATVLTAAYLASRDNSAIMGENVSDAAAARWGAASGLNLGVAILETEVDWRSNHADGRIIYNYPLARADVGVYLDDLETDGAPGNSTTYVRVRSRASAGQIEHDAAAVLSVAVPHLADVGLSEFALFARDGIDLSNHATLNRWPEAPLSQLSRPIAVGTRSVNFGSVSLSSNTAAIDTVAWLPPGASETPVSNGSNLDVDAVFMDDAIPLPAAPSPGVSAPAESSFPTVDVATMTAPVSDTWRINADVRVGQGATLTTNFSSGGVLVIDGSLDLQRQARLVTSGDATIVVFGDVRLRRDAGIELLGGSQLRMFIRGNLNLDEGGFIGESNGRTGGPNGDGLGHIDLGRIHLFSISDDDRDSQWLIDKNSIVKGNLYAPDAGVRVNNSIACGRLVGREIALTGSTQFLYDHGLDRRAGYTNFNSPLYDNYARLKDGVLTLASLDDHHLLTLASTYSMVVRALNRTHGTPPPADIVAIGDDPTPRKINVSYSRVLYDTAVSEWER